MKYKYVIVGAGIAGTTAAFEIRKHSPDPVLLVGNEGAPLYNRILLPHLLKKEFAEDRLFIKKTEDYKNAGIDFLPDARVTGLDINNRALMVGSEEILFEKLLLATGTTPHELKLGRPAHQLQTLKDARQIEKDLAGAESAVVIGGGFIALEFLGVLSSLGVKTRAILREPLFFHKFFDMTCDRILTGHLRSLGIEVTNSVSVIDDTIFAKADFIGAGIGVRRNIELAKNAGLMTNIGIHTDNKLETSSHGIFAAGDVAEYETGGKHRVFGNWTNALGQGRRAGLNMAGESAPFDALPNYSTSTVGINISTFGIVDPGDADKIVGRGSVEEKSYARLFIKDARVIGAALVNRLFEAAVISSLIKEKTNIDEKRLANTAINIENTH